MKIISTVQAIDISNILHVAESCGLFQTEELGEVGGMIDAFLSGELEGHQWLVLREDDQVKATAYYAPEAFADGV